MTEPTSAPLEPRGAAGRTGTGTMAWVAALGLAAVLGALLFLGGYLVGGAGAGTGCAAPEDEFAAFCEAYDQLQRQYVDDLDEQELVEGAIQGMFQYGVGDPNSGYMAPDQYEQALGDLSGSFGGIGAEMAVTNTTDPADIAGCAQLSATCRLVVIAPLAGTPAEEAGILAGDVVGAVNGDSVDGSTMNDQITQIRGEPGTDVTLTIEREGEAPFDVTITREEIVLQEVEARIIDGHVGYIALNAFSAQASEQFSSSLAGLLEDGADQIVFDLRDNPGGYIEAAQEIASQFIDSGLIFTQESAGNDVREYPSTGDGVATSGDLPVVVLVNGGTASSSEIVAAALQEAGRATVIGEPTFGKNTVQVWSRLENGGGVRITISRWFTPEHNSVAPDGIQPDIAVARSADTPPEEDPVLDAALEHLAEQPVADDATSAAPAQDGRLALEWPLAVGIVGSRSIC